jgi:hypothetical protein
MNRRDFLRGLLMSSVAAYTLDIDKLLWVPGQKKIFIPDNKIISASQIVALEMERIVPHIHHLFEMDNIFYQKLYDGSVIEANRDFRMPLVIKPGNIDWSKEDD